jgi:DNA-binding transcriptional ArsR family regulator
MADRVPDELLETMAAKFRLIGEPTRLAILHALMDGAEKNVGQVVAETGRAEVNVSRHLKQLAKGKMLARRKAGLQVFYRLTDPVIEQVCRLVCRSLANEAKEKTGPPADAGEGGGRGGG